MADAIYVKTSPRVLIRRGPPGPAGATGPQGPTGSSGSGTIDSVTNLLEGDGAGAAVDSGIDPDDVTAVIANNTGTSSGANTGDQTNISGSSATAAALSVSGQTGLFTVTGLASTNRAKVVRDAADTILELGGSYTPTGTWTSMNLVGPALGTPTALVGTNITGTAASLTAGSATTATTATTASAVPVGGITGLGTGVATALAVNVGSAGAPVVLNGVGGTPSSMTGTNINGTAASLNIGGSSASLSVSGQTGVMTVTGLTSTNRAKTVRNAADTILELGGSYTPTGTWTSMTFVTPVLGQPTSGDLSNCTGFPAGTAPDISDVTGLGTGVETALGINVGSAGAVVVLNGAGGTPSSMTATNLSGTAASLTAGTASAVAVGGITGLGTGVGTALAVNVGSAGAPVLFNGAGGTPSSMTGTNISGTAASLTAGTASAVAVGGISGLGTGVATALAINVGTAGAPVVLNGAGGTPSSMTATNLSGTASSLTAGNATTAAAVAVGGITGLGTGVGTALAVNVGSAGAPVLFNGAGGTPSSLTGTNISGTAASLTAGHATDATALSVSGQTGLMTVTGLTSTNRAKTIRDAADTILELGGSYTPTGTWTSLTMVTPVLGTPTSGTLTNCTALPVSGITASTSTALGVGSIELGHATATTLTGSSGVLSVEGTAVPTISSTSTFTNKRITKRVGSTASSATPSIDSDSYDMYKITALAAAITSLTITGTPTDGQSLILVIIDDGTARAIAFGTTTQVASTDLAFPTTTVLSKYLYCTFIYNSVLTKWVMTGKLTNI